MKKLNYTQRGDTLVEVLIAITIVGIVVAGVMSIMNRSYVSILNSAERTAVRAEINSQSELLWYIHDNNETQWGIIKGKAIDSASIDDAYCAFGTASDNCARTNCTLTSESFYIDGSISVTNATSARNTNGRATVGSTGGIIIDAVRNATAPPGYIDFYIKACWAPLGNMPNSESTTIVRIKE